MEDTSLLYQSSEMLDNEDIPLFQFWHEHSRIHGTEAIKHGVNILSEKPLTMNTRKVSLILQSLSESTIKLKLITTGFSISPV
jgi:hypothetical protein